MGLHCPSYLWGSFCIMFTLIVNIFVMSSLSSGDENQDVSCDFWARWKKPSRHKLVCVCAVGKHLSPRVRFILKVFMCRKAETGMCKKIFFKPCKGKAVRSFLEQIPKSTWKGVQVDSIQPSHIQPYTVSANQWISVSASRWACWLMVSWWRIRRGRWRKGAFLTFQSEVTDHMLLIVLFISLFKATQHNDCHSQPAILTFSSFMRNHNNMESNAWELSLSCLCAGWGAGGMCCSHHAVSSALGVRQQSRCRALYTTPIWNAQSEFCKLHTGVSSALWDENVLMLYLLILSVFQGWG